MDDTAIVEDSDLDRRLSFGPMPKDSVGATLQLRRPARICPPMGFNIDWEKPRSADIFCLLCANFVHKADFGDTAFCFVQSRAVGRIEAVNEVHDDQKRLPQYATRRQNVHLYTAPGWRDGLSYVA